MPREPEGPQSVESLLDLKRKLVAATEQMGRVSEFLLQQESWDLFVTVFYAVLEPQTGRLLYCNAGHNPPFLFRAANGSEPEAVETLGRTSLPLGILADMEAAQDETELEQGDLLVLYTDGITEAQDEFEDFFGEEEMCELIADYRHRPVQIVGDKLVAAVYDFMGEAPQHDDITLVLLARRGE